MRVQTLERKIIEQITKPTERGQQKSVGPSQIGGCPRCLGESLALRLPEQYPDIQHMEEFGLGSWIGTAVHSYLESEVNIRGAIKEQKNFIYHLEGYGDIKGSTDLWCAGHIKDWKVLGKFMYDELCLQYLLEPGIIPKVDYRAQQQLYGYGWETAGYEVKTVGLVVIPKASNNVRDIKFFTEDYSRQYAEGVLRRLDKIWQWVQDGKLEELPIDETCYRCTRVLYRA